uniref:Putative HIRAN domain containing protein n=1 Tax=viral metagenome TaxID=1070528 RepID=A0A6M3KNJ9_9ZZZZ
MEELVTKLAGVTFGNRQKLIKTFMELGNVVPSEIILKREPDNKFDPNAINVMIRDQSVGYIPKDIAIDLAPLMDIEEEINVTGFAFNVLPHENKPIGMTIVINGIDE